MRTKDFNSILQNVPYKEVTSGLYEEIELLAGKFLIIFALDCDIEVVYYLPSTYLNPEEAEMKETKEIHNIKVLSDDYETKYTLNEVQEKKLIQEIDFNLKVIY